MFGQQASSPNVMLGNNQLLPATSNEALPSGAHGLFNQKSNSVGGDLSINFKRPGTASNLDFSKGIFNNQDDSNQVGAEDNEAMALGIRPRTSQPNTYSRRAGDLSHPLGSGVGAGNVNAMLGQKYHIDK